LLPLLRGEAWKCGGAAGFGMRFNPRHPAALHDVLPACQLRSACRQYSSLISYFSLHASEFRYFAEVEIANFHWRHYHFEGFFTRGADGAAEHLDLG
jgi:hypothetical protein